MDEYLQRLRRAAQIDPSDGESRERYVRAFNRATGHFPQCDKLKYEESDAEQAAAYEKAVDEYEAKWPKYCRKCWGWGGNHGYDYSTGMQDFDPCQTCLEVGDCPQCGIATAELLEDQDDPQGGYYDYFACSSCGWNDLEPDGHPTDPPQPTDCNCWELEHYGKEPLGLRRNPRQSCQFCSKRGNYTYGELPEIFLCKDHYLKIWERVKKSPAPRDVTKARSTGTTIHFDYGNEESADPSLPWTLICIDHVDYNNVKSFETKSDAISWMSAPEDWCAGCIDQRSEIKDRRNPGDIIPDDQCTWVQMYRPRYGYEHCPNYVFVKGDGIPPLCSRHYREWQNKEQDRQGRFVPSGEDDDTRTWSV
jgi:hypothetical protein